MRVRVRARVRRLLRLLTACDRARQAKRARVEACGVWHGLAPGSVLATLLIAPRKIRGRGSWHRRLLGVSARAEAGQY